MVCVKNVQIIGNHSNLGDDELLAIETGSSDWYCTNCKADCGMCSRAVLNGHKAVQCDGCDLWLHNECSFISDADYENVLTSGCTRICPKCEFFNFSDPFFDDQLNLVTENRFNPLSKDKNVRLSSNSSNESNFNGKTFGGLKLVSFNINSIRGKKLNLLAFLDVHQPHAVAKQETKNDSSVATSEFFPETFPYNVFRKGRNLHGGGVMLLIHKDIPHMPLSEIENDSESVWVKILANKTSHYVASWYRQLGGSSEEFQLFRDQLDHIRTKHKGNKLPSVHVLGGINFNDIAWPGT